MDNTNNNNVVSMRDYLEAKNKEEEHYYRPSLSSGVKVIQDYIKFLSKVEKENKEKERQQLSMKSIEDAIHYEYKASNEVLVTFESKDEIFKILKKVGLGELLRIKYCNLDNPVIKEFFELIKKED